MGERCEPRICKKCLKIKRRSKKTSAAKECTMVSPRGEEPCVRLTQSIIQLACRLEVRKQLLELDIVNEATRKLGSSDILSKKEKILRDSKYDAETVGSPYEGSSAAFYSNTLVARGPQNGEVTPELQRMVRSFVKVVVAVLGIANILMIFLVHAYVWYSTN